MQDSKKRSILKTLTSKLVEIAISAGALQIIFGQPLVSLGLPTLLEGLQMISYYFHERLWNKVRWGNGCEQCRMVNK
jgi:uncharacterized membrane protein